MTKKFKELVNKLSPEAQKKIKAKTNYAILKEKKAHNETVFKELVDEAVAKPLQDIENVMFASLLIGGLGLLVIMGLVIGALIQGGL